MDGVRDLDLSAVEPSATLTYNRSLNISACQEERPPKTHEVAVTHLTEFLEVAAQQKWPIVEDQFDPPQAYRVTLDKEPIQLGIVEFRILLFLASRPYHAFTRRCIAEAVDSQRDPVTAETIDRHVATLFDQLGEFHDYVQSVPYIGYRFKA